MTHWDDLRVFLAAYRHGSHAGAGARARARSHTFGRRLGALEAALGVRLFRRSRSRLVPTDEGARRDAPA